MKKGFMVVKPVINQCMGEELLRNYHNDTHLRHKKFGLQNQLQRIVTSKFTLRMCRLNLLSISKFSDFCGISKLNFILYQIFIVIEPKIQERYLYFSAVPRCI